MATIKLTQDFREFLQLLDSEKIEYLLIGGYAVALYGYERPTKDIDVWVACDPASQERIAAVLVKFGFAASAIRQPLFTSEKSVLRIGFPPNRFELLSTIAAVDFADCYARRRVMEIDGLMVPVIDYDDLIRNKSATGRASDRVDVERLQKRRHEP
jgi:hypothetical protein